jgi:hypothetical protein
MWGEEVACNKGEGGSVWAETSGKEDERGVEPEGGGREGGGPKIEGAVQG